jgi:antirestriction protein ArdC
MCRTYTVFNVEQCDGLSIPAPVIDRPQIDTNELCESIVNGWESRPMLHLDNEHEGRAFYRPSTDAVHMPARNRFVDAPTITQPCFMSSSIAPDTRAALPGPSANALVMTSTAKRN